MFISHPLEGKLVVVTSKSNYYKENKYDHYLYTVKYVYEYYSTLQVQLLMHSLLPDKKGNKYRDDEFRNKTPINMLLSDVSLFNPIYTTESMMNKFMSNF